MSKNIKWLYDELPKLVSENILDEEASLRIKKYYGSSGEANWLKTALVIFGTLGAVLIASGIILIFAKNWEYLSISGRTILSLLPLLIAQVLTGWVLLKKKDSISWRESVSAFHTISIGASISLISQTYHISGDMAGFTLTWALLALPLIYFLDAATPAILYIGGITAWACFTRQEAGTSYFYWLLLALAGVYIYRKYKSDITSNASVFLGWAVMVSLCITLGVMTENILPGIWILIYLGFFTAVFLLGQLIYSKDEPLWQKPLLVVGVIGTLVVSYMQTYQGQWNNMGLEHYGERMGNWGVTGMPDYIMAAFFLFAASYLVYLFIKRKEFVSVVFSMSFIAAIAGIVIVSFDVSWLPQIIFDIYLLATGIMTVAEGIRRKRIGLANGGMLIIALLIVLRFFDSDLEFMVRGIAFVLVGMGFLASNIYLVKRQRRAEQ